MSKSISAADERLPEIIDRLKHGSSLTLESRKLGFLNNGALREALRAKVGPAIYEQLVPQNGWKKDSR